MFPVGKGLDIRGWNEFPIIHVHSAWVTNNNLTLAESWHIGLSCIVISVIVAYGSMKLFDQPVREWLKKKLLV